MANKVILSEQFKVKLLDFFNGLIYGVGIPLIYYLQEYIPGWDVHPLLKVAAGSFITHIIKKYLEKPQVTTVYSTNAKATKVSEDIKEGL